MTQRCTGECCRSFMISIDPDKTAVEVMQMLREEVPGKPGRTWEQGDIIADMLIPIFGPWPKVPAAQARFTCKNFDGRNCMIYESRPGLCRRHGETTACDYADCELQLIPPAKLMQASIP